MSLLFNIGDNFLECGSLFLQLGRRYEHSDEESYMSCCTDVFHALHPGQAQNMFV